MKKKHQQREEEVRGYLEKPGRQRKLKKKWRAKKCKQ